MRAIVACLLLSALTLPGVPALAQGPPQAAAAQKTAVAAPTVNLNTATVEQLQKLPGIGPKTAARIVEYRQKHGGFKKIEELMNVRGVGEKSFLRIRSQLAVTPAKANQP
jgi:competence protein ComEA